MAWGGARTFMLSYSAYERRAAEHGVGLGWGGAKTFMLSYAAYEQRAATSRMGWGWGGVGQKRSCCTVYARAAQ